MILLVAPRTNLEYVDDEIQRVVNFLRPRVLIGNVTLGQVVDELQREHYDIIWFASHSSDEGVLLSDGFMTAAMLAQLIQPSPPRLVFINTCNSLPIIMEIHDAANCMVIGTVREVPDREAFVTGSALARAISTGMELADAYNVSRPSQNRTYIMLNGSIKLNGDREIDDTNQLLMLVLKRQDEMDKHLKAQLGQLEDSIRSEYQPKITPGRLALLALGYIVFIISNLFISHQLPYDLRLTPLSSLTVMAILQVLAGGIFLLSMEVFIEKRGERN